MKKVKRAGSGSLTRRRKRITKECPSGQPSFTSEPQGPKMAVSTIFIHFRAGHPRSDHDAEDGVTKRGRQTLRPTETWILSKSSRFEILTPATTKKSLRLRTRPSAVRTMTTKSYRPRTKSSGTRDVLRHVREVLRHVRGDARRAPARERGAPARKVLRHKRGVPAHGVLRHAREVLRHARGDARRAPARERGAPARKVFRHMGCFGTREVLRHARCSGTGSGAPARDVLRSAQERRRVMRQRRDHGRLRNGRDSGV